MAIRPWYWPEKGQPERTEPFTWIVEGVLAASWWPGPGVFARFEEEGIKSGVNVCEFDNRRDVPEHLVYHFIPVTDYGMSFDQAAFPRVFFLSSKKPAVPGGRRVFEKNGWFSLL